MKSAVLSGSVYDRAELSGILDLPLNKVAFSMAPWFSLSKDINGRCILSKLRMGSQISCRNRSTLDSINTCRFWDTYPPRTLTPGCIHPVRVKAGHSNPNFNLNPNPNSNSNPNPNPKDRG